jgi:hypothetical protein
MHYQLDSFARKRKRKAQLAESVTSTGAEGLTSDKSEDGQMLILGKGNVNSILKVA